MCIVKQENNRVKMNGCRMNLDLNVQYCNKCVEGVCSIEKMNEIQTADQIYLYQEYMSQEDLRSCRRMNLKISSNRKG